MGGTMERQSRTRAKTALRWALLLLLAALAGAAISSHCSRTASAQPGRNAGPGQKGLQVHPNELPAQAHKISAADTRWVRIEFKMEPDGPLDLARYDGVVDGVIDDPTRCTYDPAPLIGTATSDGPFTKADADIVRAIWEGPRGHGGRARTAHPRRSP